MKSRRLQIEEALHNMIHAQRTREFQWLAVQIGKMKWPELEATLEQSDGGEDATAFFVGSDGKRRRLAVSLTGTLEKVRADADRLRDRNVKLDVLVFVTPVPLTHLQVSDWCTKVYEEFHHELHVISRSELVAVLERPGNADLCREYLHLDFRDQPELGELEASARTAAQAILGDWKAEFRCDSGLATELTLVRETTPGSTGDPTASKSTRMSLGEVTRLVAGRGRVIVTGPPGAGKTFTLIQIAELLLKDASAPIPVLVSLPGWASRGCDFQAYVEQQLRDRGISETAFSKLRTVGRIALLLNGWNEIPEIFGASKATGQLQDFSLNNAATPLIVSTRTTTLAPPLSRPIVIRVHPLSREQKLRIIERSGLSDPSKLFLALERIPTLATVTETPLFLAAIVELARRGVEDLPTSRFAILEGIIGQAEQKAQAALAERPCEGFHRHYLAYIAYTMTNTGKTVLSRAEVLAAVADAGKALQSEGHIASAPASSAVLESLVKHHLLVFSPSVGGAFRFVHQQFQEWFAAEWLLGRVSALAREPHPDRVFGFQREVLNHARWFQVVAFQLEQLAAGSEEEHRVAAKLVEWALPIDLILAAELAGIAGASVWSLVRELVGPAVRTWYARDGARHRRCALAAMLATTAPDFQDVIWPLLESDEQEMRWTCRAWRPFPLTSLGPGFRSRFNLWDEYRRTVFVQEMSLDPGDAHIAFATELARTDRSLEVKLACLDLLAGAGAYETVVEILGSSTFGVWPDGIYGQLLRRLPKRHIISFCPRLKAAFDGSKGVGVRRSILELLHSAEDPEWLERAKAEAQRLTMMPGVSFRAQYWLLPESEKRQLNVGPYIAEYLDELFGADPGWAAEWLVGQLSQGRLWEEPFIKHLNGLPNEAIEKLTSAALNLTAEVNADRNRVALFAAMGSGIPARSILKAHLEWVKQHKTEGEAGVFTRSDVLLAGIRELPLSSLVDGILEMAQSVTEFQDLRILVETALPGLPMSPGWRTQLSESQKGSLRSVVFRLQDLEPTNLQDRDWFRSQLGALLGAVGRPEDAKVLESWIEEERRRRAVEDAEWHAQAEACRQGKRAARSLGPRTIRMAWNSWCEALAQLGGAKAAEVLLKYVQVPEFLGYASWGLVSLLNQTDGGDPDAPLRQRPVYGEIYDRRRKLAASAASASQAANQYAEAVHSAILEILPALTQPESRAPRQELFSATAALARLDHRRAVPVLLKLCSDKLSHWTVAMAFHALVLDGVLLPGKDVAAALEPFIAEHEKEPWSSSQDNWYAVVQCLAVLLFSDDPRVGVERIRRLPPNRLKSHHIRDILGLLGICRAPEAADLLVSFSGASDVTGQYFHELLAAMSESAAPAAKEGVMELLNRLAAGQLPASHDTIEPLAKVVAHFARMDSTVWESIKARCRDATNPAERAVLAETLHMLGSDEAAIAVCDLIRDDLPMSYHVERVIEEAAENRVPAGGQGAYYLEPRGAGELRRRLFELATQDTARRMNALELLAVIAERRLEHGRPPDEPFHPDIQYLESQAVPWPLLLK